MGREWAEGLTLCGGPSGEPRQPGLSPGCTITPCTPTSAPGEGHPAGETRACCDRGRCGDNLDGVREGHPSPRLPFRAIKPSDSSPNWTEPTYLLLDPFGGRISFLAAHWSPQVGGPPAGAWGPCGQPVLPSEGPPPSFARGLHPSCSRRHAWQEMASSLGPAPGGRWGRHGQIAQAAPPSYHWSQGPSEASAPATSSQRCPLCWPPCGRWQGAGGQTTRNAWWGQEPAGPPRTE